MYLYSGTPGSGKSLHQTKVICKFLKERKPVLANFPIDLKKIKGRHLGQFVFTDNSDLNPEKLINFSRDYFKTHKFGEGKILLMIDESQLLFNSRDWAVKGRDNWLKFFSNHRHFGFDIILIAQFDRMIDRQIRSLFEYEIIHRKVSNFGMGGKMLSLASGGNLFCAVTIWYPLKEKISSEFFKASKKYFAIYDSYKDFTDTKVIEQPKKINNVRPDIASIVNSVNPALR